MKTTPRTRMLLALLAVVAIAGGALLLRSLLFERVERVEDLGYSGEAAVNPLLALERLLERKGIEAESARGFARLPGPGELLLVAAQRRSVGEAGAARLLDWTAEGGHLVIVATPLQLDDPLLTPLEVHPHHLPATEAQRERAKLQREEDPFGDEGADEEILGNLRLRYLGWEDPLLVEGEEGAATLLRLGWGEGLVTVLAEPDFLTSEQLAEGDNALHAWRALVPEEVPAAALLIFRDKRPSAWALLAGRAKPVALALALLVAAWLWKGAARFGPLLPLPEPERRSLAEHLRAAGRWQWDCRAQRVLIDAEREILQLRLGHGHDGELDDRAAQAGERAGLDEERVRQALAQRAPGDRTEFTRTVRVLEELTRSTR